MRSFSMAMALFPAFLNGIPAAAATFSYPAKGVQIETASGPIEAATDAVAIEISVKLILVGEPSDCEISTQVQDQRLYLSARRAPGARSECRSGFRVTGPAALSIAAKSTSGAMTASGFNGALSAENADGSVSLRNVSGPVSATTGSGRISGTVSSSQLQASSRSGSIALSWDRVKPHNQVDVKSDSGDVDLEFPPEAQLRTRVITASNRKRNDDGIMRLNDVKIFVTTNSGKVSIRKR